jgi:hypothetical protein
MVDVLLTVAVCVIQLALGYMGVQVSLKPPLPKHHKFWIAAFIAVSLVGAGFTGWLAVRSENAATLASNQIREMRDELAHVHMRPNIGLYGIDDPTHIPKNWEPFMAGSEAAFRLYYTNSSGTSTAKEVGVQGELFPTTTKPNFEAEFSKVSSKFPPGWHGEELGPQDTQFISPKSSVLSESESEGIKRGTMRVVLIAEIRFSDSTGNYEQDVCDWLQPHSYDVWHGCGPQYESEKKLK